MAQLPTDPLFADYLAGEILTLVIPLAVFIAIAIWYVVVWRKGAHEGTTSELKEPDAQRVGADTQS
jgi:hypothetical protein